MKLYDLSKPLSERSLRWPGQPKVRFVDRVDTIRDGMMSSLIEASLHTGTHIDAPSHFPGGSMQEIHDIPLERLCGSGVVIDVTRDDFGVVTASDLEGAKPKITVSDRVVLNFGWHRLVEPDLTAAPERFMLRYPGLDKSAVDWCVRMKLSWLGSDTPSPDHSFNLSQTISRYRPDVFDTERLASIDRSRFPVEYCHRTLLSAGIPMIEQLGGDIDAITGRRVTFFALPLKVVAEGAPIRLVAVEDL